MVEVALQYNTGYSELVYAFANCINTPDGGTHLTGFRTAITRALNDHARKQKFLSATITPTCPEKTLGKGWQR